MTKAKTYRLAHLMILVLQAAAILALYRFADRLHHWPKIEFVRMSAIYLGIWLAIWDAAWLFLSGANRVRNASLISIGAMLVVALAACAYYVLGDTSRDFRPRRATTMAMGRLAITRKKGERFRARFEGRDLWVSVAQIRPSRVKLLIEAEPEVEVLREELIKANE